MKVSSDLSLSAWFLLSKAGIQYRTVFRVIYNFCKYCHSAKICIVIKDDKSPVPTALGQFSVETDFMTGMDISSKEPHTGEPQSVKSSLCKQTALPLGSEASLTPEASPCSSVLYSQVWRAKGHWK